MVAAEIILIYGEIQVHFFNSYIYDKVGCDRAYGYDRIGLRQLSQEFLDLSNHKVRLQDVLTCTTTLMTLLTAGKNFGKECATLD